MINIIMIDIQEKISFSTLTHSCSSLLKIRAKMLFPKLLNGLCNKIRSHEGFTQNLTLKLCKQ